MWTHLLLFVPFCYTNLFRQFQIEQLVDVFFQALQNVVLYLLKTIKIQQYFTITYHLFILSSDLEGSSCHKNLQRNS
jgi:hypothetical protein